MITKFRVLAGNRWLGQIRIIRVYIQRSFHRGMGAREPPGYGAGTRG